MAHHTEIQLLILNRDLSVVLEAQVPHSMYSSGDFLDGRDQRVHGL